MDLRIPHGPLLHFYPFLAFPLHFLPPFEGGGLVHVRLRNFLPLPHFLLHSPKSLQSVQPPSTAEKGTRHFCKISKSHDWPRHVRTWVRFKIKARHYSSVLRAQISLKKCLQNISRIAKSDPYYGWVDNLDCRSAYGIVKCNPYLLAGNKVLTTIFNCGLFVHMVTWTLLFVADLGFMVGPRALGATVGRRGIGAGAPAFLLASAAFFAALSPGPEVTPSTVNCKYVRFIVRTESMYRLYWVYLLFEKKGFRNLSSLSVNFMLSLM